MNVLGEDIKTQHHCYVMVRINSEDTNSSSCHHQTAGQDHNIKIDIPPDAWRTEENHGFPSDPGFRVNYFM